jgi:hypothetical protein
MAFILFNVEGLEPVNETEPEEPEEQENETVPMPEEPENETVPMPDEPENETEPVILAESTEDGDGDGEGIADAIARAWDYHGKLNDMIGELRVTYGDDADILLMLDDVQDVLDAAYSSLTAANEAGDNNAAAGHLSDARSIMGKAKGLLTSVFKQHKMNNMMKFGEQVQNRIVGIQSKIGELGDGLENGPEVASALGETKLKMSDVMKLLKDGNTSEAMNILGSIVGEIDTSIMSLGNETAVQFKSMVKLEAKIRVLEKQASKLERKGFNATEVYDMIAGAQSQLSQLSGSLGKGKGNKGGNGVVDLGGSGGGPKDGLKGYEKPKKNGKASKGGKKPGNNNEGS